MELKWIIKKLEKYSDELIVVLSDAFEVIGRPKNFYLSTGANKGVNSVILFTLFLSLALVALEMPIMAKFGINRSNIEFHSFQVFVTILLFFIYSLCFQVFFVFFRESSSYFDTFKVVTYSSIWYLIMSPCVYLLQMIRFESMAKNSDVLNMGYYDEFRIILDNSALLHWINVLGLLFPILFTIWVYKGFYMLQGVHRLKAFLCAVGGSIVMQIVVHFIQNPMNHLVIQAFK